MAKRFTDSEKWKKPWFRSLSPVEKCFWVYVLDNCDQAGIWDVDFQLASFCIGDSLDEVRIREVFKKQYAEVAGGKRWHIPDFLDFQYGELRYSNRLHAFVLNLLKKQGVLIPLKRVPPGAKDKDKNKDRVESLRSSKQENVFRDQRAVSKNDGKEAFKKPSVPELTDAFMQGGMEAAVAESMAQKFLSYYESCGWVIGRTRKPMRSWRGAVSTWLQNCHKNEETSGDSRYMTKAQKHNLDALNKWRQNRESRNDGEGGTAPISCLPRPQA